MPLNPFTSTHAAPVPSMPKCIQPQYGWMHAWTNRRRQIRNRSTPISNRRITTCGALRARAAEPAPAHRLARHHRPGPRVLRAVCAIARRETRDKRHFLAYAAKVMRSVIVDAARAQCGTARGDLQETTLNSAILDNVTLETGVIRIDEAVDALQRWTSGSRNWSIAVLRRAFHGRSSRGNGYSLARSTASGKKHALILMDAIASQ